jgi:hypothetical protein
MLMTCGSLLGRDPQERSSCWLGVLVERASKGMERDGAGARYALRV